MLSSRKIRRLMKKAHKLKVKINTPIPLHANKPIDQIIEISDDSDDDLHSVEAA